MKHAPRISIPITVGALASLGCTSGDSPPSVSGAHGPPPAHVSVGAATVVVGFSVGTIQQNVDVAAFDISATPTTVAEYRACVAAGACTPPKLTTGSCDAALLLAGSTYSETAANDELPLTCATPTQMAEYCSWVGGRLPHLAEWQLAARGTSITRYPWGNAAPTCNQSARIATLSDRTGNCCGVDCATATALAVGTHSSGDSPSGVEDVLLTHVEALNADITAPYPICRPPSQTCGVSGFGPRAIDALVTLPREDSPASKVSSVGFRCVWPGGAP